MLRCKKINHATQTATPRLQHRAAQLRHNQTPAKAKLWRFLRAHQTSNVHFRRQHAIGSYIVDFCSPNQKLIIEVDSGGHLEQEKDDNERTVFLESKGYIVLRFWNNDLMKDIDGVMRVILDALNTDHDAI